MQTFSLKRYFAGLVAGLLGLLLLGAGSAAAQTITNVAGASWRVGGQTFQTSSNPVAITVVPRPVALDVFGIDRGQAAGFSYNASTCGGLPINLASAVDSGGQTPAAGHDAVLQAGDSLFFKLEAPGSNLDPSQVDRLVAVITAQSGDREVLTVYETGPNTGVFIGAIRTAATPFIPVSGDCVLTVASRNTISVTMQHSDNAAVVATGVAEVLADPYGLVFDSEDGTPVDGVRVSMVDALTGAPARVFAEDGVTRWPSSVITGQPIVDAVGNRYQLPAGEYWFPLAPLGQYRLVVEPPAPYHAPSTVAPAQLTGLTRPDGNPLIIVDGSYGRTFGLSSPAPIRIDVPLDRPAISVSLTKAVSRAAAAPGDVVFYTVTAQNPDRQRAKRNVVLTDRPSHWLRLRRSSIRVDGVAVPDAVTVSADGRTLTINLGNIAAGASRVVTYAMTIRADAPPGQAVNRAEAVDARGSRAETSVAVRIERDALVERMTIIGRISSGDCSVARNRPGVPGVRVMLEDGSYAITDADGRYHLDGVVPGTHVVQAQSATLPAGAEFIDCSRSTRSAGSTSSRFVTGQGGSLKVVDFKAIVPDKPVAASAEGAAIVTDQEAAGASLDWLAMGDGPIDWLFPTVDHNPRAPAVRVVVRHRPGQTVELKVDGRPVDPVAFDGSLKPANGTYAVSIWRGVPITGDVARLNAVVRNADGSIAATLDRPVYFAAQPARVEIVPEKSRLIADGATRPVLAVRILDRNNRPVHAGISGQFNVNAPYESAQVLDAMQTRALAGLNRSETSWSVKGDDGIALIELGPTMISGALRLEFNFADGDIQRSQMIDSWIVPGDQKWTLVGLAEGSVGAQTVADNMQRSGRFDSDLGKHARVAFYAKGRVLGKYLLTLAYDSAKQKDDQRLSGAINPRAYYTVFADGSDRRFDAASREKLYIRIETATFYALFGDIETGFDQTQLARYQRSATGIKAEYSAGGLHAQGFAARIGSTHRRDEIQGGGITGPYPLSSRAIIANSETVVIEVRDRFRSELIVDRRTLSRFVDYDIDLLSGTITFKEPVLSRDFSLNPQFIVIDYEVDAVQGGAINAGVRADLTTGEGAVRIGTTVITDTGASANGTQRTNLAAVDLKARLGKDTELRAEAALSRKAGETSNAWLVELEHHDGKLDVLGYVRSSDAAFGLGQTNGAERGRRKIGLDARYRVTDDWSVSASGWHDTSLTDATRRTAVQLGTEIRRRNTDGRLAFTSFNDRLADGSTAASNVVEAGVRQRLFNSRLEVDASTSVSLGKAGSVDLPDRHRLGLRYLLSPSVRLVGTYEIAKGEAVNARTVRAGFELTPWTGAKIVTTLGQQSISEYGKRSFAAYGLAQSFDLSSRFTIDASIDGSKTLAGIDAARLINREHPAASGGNLGEGATIAEDFSAYTLGGTYRAGLWSATIRGEFRDGELANRRGITFGAIRQLGEGSMVGSGLTWTRANMPNGSATEVMEAAVAIAHRPANSRLALLSKVEYRSDAIVGGIAGLDSPAGRTAFDVTGDATSRRLIASVSANWTPHERDAEATIQRSELGVFVGMRYNFDRFQGYDFDGTTLFASIDARKGVGEKVELGIIGSVRRNLEDKTTSFAIGPQIGFSPVKDTLLTVGYNITGFRDPDFTAARNTEKGLFAALRIKFDADSLRFLGLGR